MQQAPKRCPRWVDTDKCDADRPNYRSRLVVREIEEAMKRSDVPSAAELFSGIPPLESVTVKMRRKASKLLQCTTSAVHTFMGCRCDEFL